MSSVLEELPAEEVSDVPAGLLPNALAVEVVEVQLDAGSVMVSRV